MPSSFSSPQSVFGLSPDLDDLSISNGLHSLSITDVPKLDSRPVSTQLHQQNDFSLYHGPHIKKESGSYVN